MEIIKFYLVQIGTTSRKGNFTAFKTLCAKSEKDIYTVRNLYQERYEGFDVKITNVENIDAPILSKQERSN